MRASRFALASFYFSSIILLFLLVLLPPPLSWAKSEAILRCLEQNSQYPSYQISTVIYSPTNASYSSVLQAYVRNLRYNESTTRIQPRFILTALHVSHIQAAIVCAKTHGLQMKIRSGGHDFEGISYWSEVPFFILDMFHFRSISVNIEEETAWVQAGATLGEVYYAVAEKSNNTRAFPAGVCPTVGVGGHFSGGGYGNMMRKYGISVDNIVDAQVIDVNGRLLDRKAMGEDMFWAITGGGGASFCAVLAYKINLVSVPEKVTVFLVARTREQNATGVVHRWQEVADKLHEDIFIRMIIDVVNITTTTSGAKKTTRASFFTLFLGDTSRLLSLMDESFPELGLKQSDCTEMTWAESVVYYTGFPAGTPVSTALLSRTPQGLTHLKIKSDYLKEPIPKAGLEFIFDRMVELEKPRLTFNPYGGKMAEISPFAKPFPHRRGNIAMIQYLITWDNDGEVAANHYLNLTRMLYGYMTPFVSKNPREHFLNYRDLDLGINHNGDNSYIEGFAYGIEYFLGNYYRLLEVKTKVDPHNFFRNEQSIPVIPRSVR